MLGYVPVADIESEVTDWSIVLLVSGMKKRESQSETFSANPFEYEFLYAPLGDKGAYAYQQPWYGFSVNKDSEEKEIAVEFLRFMMQEKEIDEMASIKGLPSVAENGTESPLPIFAAFSTRRFTISRSAMMRSRSIVSMSPMGSTGTFVLASATTCMMFSSST